MRCQFANGNRQPWAPLSTENSNTHWRGSFAFTYISEALVEIQSVNIEDRAGDTKIALLLFAPNHIHSNRWNMYEVRTICGTYRVCPMDASRASFWGSDTCLTETESQWHLHLWFGLCKVRLTQLGSIGDRQMWWCRLFAAVGYKVAQGRGVYLVCTGTRWPSSGAGVFHTTWIPYGGQPPITASASLASEGEAGSWLQDHAWCIGGLGGVYGTETWK